MSAWNYGCGVHFQKWIARGFGSREITVTCGSTDHHGGVWQCEACATRVGQPPRPHEDEGDAEYDQRIHAAEISEAHRQ